MVFSRGHAFRGVLRAGAWAAVTVLIGTAALASESGSHDGTNLVALSGRGTASEPTPAGSSSRTTLRGASNVAGAFVCTDQTVTSLLRLFYILRSESYRVSEWVALFERMAQTWATTVTSAR